MRAGIPHGGWLFRLAWNDLKGGRRSFAGVLLSMVLAAAAVTCLSQLNLSLRQSLQDNSRSLLGGDIRLVMKHKPLDQRGLFYLAAKGRVTQGVRLRAMAGSKAGKNLLAEVRAVDRQYPLLGHLRLAGDKKLPEALAPQGGIYGAVADQAFAVQLGLAVGDTFKLMGIIFRLNGILLSEPDRELVSFDLGPRLMVSPKGLLASGLVSPHSLPSYTYTVFLDAPERMEEVTRRLRKAYQGGKADIITHLDAVDYLSQPMEWIVLVLMLLGSATVLVAGLGIGFGIKVHLDSKDRLLAVMKSLGCGRGQIFAAFLIQVGLISLLGCLAGGILGGSAAALLISALAKMTGLALTSHLWSPEALCGPAMGLGTALIFTLRPLWCASRVSVSQLFRIQVDQTAQARDRLFWGLAAAGAGALQLILIWIFMGGAMLLVGFALTAAVLACEFFFISRLLFALLKHLPKPSSPPVAHALMKLYQPGANSLSLVLCLGLGVSLLSGILLTENSLRQFFSTKLLEQSPAFFFLGIQPNRLKDFYRIARQTDGVKEVRAEPSLLAQITAVNDDAVSDYTWNTIIDTYMEEARPISFAAGPPPGAELSRGRWWPEDYTGSPQVSVDMWIARLLDLKPGDTLTLGMAQSQVRARVANLRSFNWRSLRLYHPLVLNRHAVGSEPYTYMAEVFVDPGQESELLANVANSFPNVQGISPKTAVAEFIRRLSALGAALSATAMLFLICSLLMLWQAVKMNLKTRSYENALWKVMGATRFDLSLTLLVEFGLITLFAVLIGSFSGWGLAQTVSMFLLDIPEVTGLGAVALTGAACIMVTLLLCLGQSLRIYRLNIRKLFGEL